MILILFLSFSCARWNRNVDDERSSEDNLAADLRGELKKKNEKGN
jgi:hypothetical protein